MRKRHPIVLPRTVAATVLCAATLSICSGASHAQYIARKLSRISSGLQYDSQSANAIGTKGVLGTIDPVYQSATHSFGARWDATTGQGQRIDDTTGYTGASGAWAMQEQNSSTIYITNIGYQAKNLTTGTIYDLGYTSGASNSSGYTSTSAYIVGNYAFSNTRQHLFGSRAYYDSYSSRVVDLTTGQALSMSWDYAPFSSNSYQFVGAGNGQVLVNKYGSYSLINIATGAETSVSPNLASVLGMNGALIAGNKNNTGALYNTTTGTTLLLSSSGLSSASVKAVGTNQTLGQGTLVGNTQNAVIWNNTSGAVTNLQNYLPTAYTSSTAIALDTGTDNGSILLQASGSSGTDNFALRSFDGNTGSNGVNEISSGEEATFVDDHTQNGGIVSIDGSVKWTNPPHWWNLQNGLLTGSGYLYGNLNNNGVLSGGSAGGFGGGGGTGGGGTGGGGYVGSGGAGYGIGNFIASGAYTQGASGTLLVSIGATGFDTFTFGGTATLGGTLYLDLADGFTPTLGQTFEFFAAPNLVGTWDSIQSNRGSWNITYTPTSASATFLGTAATAAPEPGGVSLGLTAALPLLGMYLRRKRG